MERGVVVGAVLISISLLLAMILNASASREALRIDAEAAEQSSSSGVGTDEHATGETAEHGAHCPDADVHAGLPLVTGRDSRGQGANCGPDLRRDD